MILVLSITVLWACVTAVMIRRLQNKFDILEPIVPAIAAFLLLFSARPIAMIVFDETEVHSLNISGHLEIALAICTLGVVSFFLGYFRPVRFFFSRKQNTIILIDSSKLRWVSAFYVLSAVFLVGIYLGANPLNTISILARGRGEDLSGVVTVHTEYLFASPILLPVTATIMVMRDVQRNRIRIVMPLLLVVTCVAYFYLFGVRRFIIPAVGVPIVAYLLLSGRRPAAKLILYSIPAFFIITAIPFMRTEGARSQIGGFSDQLYFAFSRPDILKDLFIGPDTEMLSTFSAQVSRMNEVNDFYFGAATLGDLVLAPIPSALVSKPMSARDRMLVEVFGSPCSGGSGKLCPDFSIIGTFYQDFWIAGVIFGMAFLGSASRIIWNDYIRSPRNPYTVAKAAVCYVFILIIIRAGFMPAFQWALYFFLPLLIGIALTSRRVPQSH